MRFRVFGRVVYISSIYLVTGLVLIIIIATVFGYILSKDDTDVIISNTPDQTSKTTEIEPTQQVLISVHVIGCVNQKKVVKIPLGSTVEDAVIAAGGFTANADKDAVNLAYKLSDGMQIKIPAKDDEDKTWIVSHGDKENNQNTGKININTATLSELLTLPGIGESLARSIIEYREKNSGFKSIEEIKQVPGIKEAKFNSIKDYITS